MGTNSQKDLCVKPKELYTGNKEQKIHIWGNGYLVNERPKDFLKGKKGQNDLYIYGMNSQKTYTCRIR